MTLRYALIVVISAWLNACASHSPELASLVEQPPYGTPRSHAIDSVPFFAQTQYHCGPAALATVLQYRGVDTTPDDLVDDVYVPDLKGSLQVEMVTAARRHQRLAVAGELTMASLLQQIQHDQPVLVLQNLGLELWPQWHYAVVTGYDLDRQTVKLHSGTNENYLTKLVTFERTWKRAKNWAMLVVEPGEITPGMQEGDYFEAAVAFEKVNEPKLTEKVYATGVAQWPGSRLLGMAYANFLYAQGKLSLAAVQYQEVLLRHPNEAAAHNNLAQVLSEQGQLEKAHRHARVAVRLGGRHAAHYAQTLAEIEAKRK